MAIAAVQTGSDSDPVLDLARELVETLEAGDRENADRVMQLLAKERESQLFREIGKLTRDLHDALVSVELDARVAGLAEREIPDAKERLRYVIERTEQAAHRTLGAVEALLPVAERIGLDAESLSEEWSRFKRRELSLDDFRTLSERLVTFLDKVRADSSALHERLSEVLIAQDYQDLTGQVIRRVIELVQEVEDNLVRMIRMSGGSVQARSRGVGGIEAEGPQVTSGGGEAVMNGQDDVDALLSSLGF